MYRLPTSVLGLFATVLCTVSTEAYANPSTSTVPAVSTRANPETHQVDQSKDANSLPASTPNRSSKLSNIVYNTQESIVLDVEQKIIHLHGAGVIEYDDVKLEAEHMSLDWPERTIAASGKTDPSGHMQEKVVCTLNGIEYIAADVRYNFESHRAIANQLFTKKDDGIFRADKVKKDRFDTFYADRGMYTTCNLVEPHFYIDARRVKLTYNNKAFSGPCRLYFNKVPTLLGLWFGLFYFPQRSGFIFPTYGGESPKGFCLKQGGYYFRFSDRMDLICLADLYSGGSRTYVTQLRYKNRYRYEGEVKYQWKRALYDRVIGMSKEETTWQFVWEHHTLHNRNSSLNAKVDLRGGEVKDIPQYVSYQDATQTHLNSSVRYHNELVGWPYTLDASLAHNKNFQTKVQDATLPSVSLQTGSLYPLRQIGLRTSWLHDIYVQHTLEAVHKLSTLCDDQRLDFSPKYWGVLLKHSRAGAKHTVPLTTNIKVLRYFNVAPKIEYRERWYGSKATYRYQDSTLIQEKRSGFYRVWDYDMGASLRTSLRGFYRFGQKSWVQAIKHQVEPHLSFTYTPDFSTPFYGYWYIARNRKKISCFKKNVYDTPADRARAVLDTTIKNTLDAKLKSSQGDGEAKKVSWLKAFDWNVSYDFLAEKFAFSDIQVDTRAEPLGETLRIHSKIVIDPYTWSNMRRIDALALYQGNGLGRIKQSSLQLQSTLQFGGTFPKDEDVSAPTPSTSARAVPSAVDYVPFVLPCRLNAEYNWTYESPEPGNSKNTRVLSLESILDLTQKWKLSFKSAYDLISGELVDTATRVQVHRDLHCWEMDFDWLPLGKQESYRFGVGVKSPLLRSLRYDRERTYQRP